MVLGAGLPAGCSAGPSNGAHPTGGAASSGPSGAVGAADQEAIDAHLAEEAEVFGVENPPHVDVVRVVTLSEQPPLVVACLEEQGFDAETSPDGQGVRITSVSEQMAAVHLAQYVCDAKYPVTPRELQPLDDAQRRTTYTYLTTTLTRCLRDHGYEVAAPPSLETFLATYDTAPWNPWDTVMVPAKRFDEVMRACPENPPSQLLWGD
jgi:hypothetical protein